MKIRKKNKELAVSPQPLPELPPHERGPALGKRLSDADGVPEPAEKPIDFGPLDNIMVRLVKRSPFTEPIVALEILSGPYKGVVYSYKKFAIRQKTEHGYETIFETEIHRLPPDFPKDWTPDEAFDTYASEIVVAWLGYVHTNDLAPLVKVSAKGIH